MRNSPLTKETLGWACYDFANSSFATSVLSVVFSVYFARSVVPPEGAEIFGALVPGESLWGYLVSAVMAVVLVLAPPLGARADRRSAKRRSLIVWAVAGSVATILLFEARPGRLLFSSALAFAAILGYEMSLVFYNAFLNDVSDEGARGRVSGLGFALGYIGGGLCLALNLWMMARPATFGLATADPTLPVRASVLVAGAWWLAFSLPTFLTVRDVPVEPKGPAGGPFAQIRRTIGEIRSHRDLARFLLAYLIYDDGIQTVLLMASIFGAKALGMPASELAACYLLIQFVAFVGALIAGRLADGLGHRPVVLGTLAVFLGATAWGATVRRPAEFWWLGIVIGLVMGGAQAASRSLFSIMVPPHKSGEFFALFSIVGKAAALIGPFVFALASQAFGLRPAVVTIGAFFLVGGLLLLTVDEKRGRSAALLKSV